MSLIDDLFPRLSSHTPDVLSFAQNLFSSVVAEDLEGYALEDLEALVLETMSFFSDRQSGRAKVSVQSVPNTMDYQGETTVFSILNDDMPFLVDSIVGFFTERGYTVHLVLHPILFVTRTPEGKLEHVFTKQDPGKEGCIHESLIQVHLSRISSQGEIDDCVTHITDILKDIRSSVLDWQSMQAKLRTAILSYRNDPPPVPVEELTETIAFLEWLLGNHFTFLGVREYTFEGDVETGAFVPIEGTGLGILRNPERHVLEIGESGTDSSSEIRAFLHQPSPLIVTKSDLRSTIHRRTQMDYIGVKQFDPQGVLIGELQLVGLFTSTTYTRSPRDIPLVRRKIAAVLSRSTLDLAGHSGKGLLNVLENFPRDELFQMDIPTLSEIALNVMRLTERPRTRVFIRHDKFDRFATVYVFIPKNRFNADLPVKIASFLGTCFGGHVEAHEPWFGENSLVRVHFVASKRGGEARALEEIHLELAIQTMVRTFEERVFEAMVEKVPPGEIRPLEELLKGAFPSGYADVASPIEAVRTLQTLRHLEEGKIAVEFSEDTSPNPTLFRLKLYCLGAPVPLSARLPILENMGMRAIEESTFTLFPAGDNGRSPVFLHEVVLVTAQEDALNLKSHQDRLKACFLAVWNGEAENDAYNTLVLRASLSWREAAFFRACGRYLRQVGTAFSNEYIAETLATHKGVTGKLKALFFTRFDPSLPQTDEERSAEEQALKKSIEMDLKEVSSLDEDRILRRFLNLFPAMRRTNFFQNKERSHNPIISFKLASRMLDDIPEPKPFAEIFVYSPDVEGVHLRGGPIARGGLRWSDRPEDFRTEILGLVKAQMVKNAVIVPVGAKGGFVPKKLPLKGTREEIFAEGTRAYQLFVSSLLELTDNLQEDGTPVSPPGMICHDGEDPYLVVAADKGTATFSDLANGLARDHGFWLDDAFASGGSAGYDHKKMGITARGAWEAVRRHFRERDVNIQTTPFRVVGIGDMSGDVFGNGMLLSRCIRLVAAFDHRDIFIDPDPDCATSFAERERLFQLPRSSWQEYDATLLSPGGGIFSRSLKAIFLTPQMQSLFQSQKESMTPSELIREILKLKVDLLWMGGIGTYVKAASETDLDVGDRTNDRIRITAGEVGAQVIGEGANLGVTQKGRIAFALRGGQINTDAVDNSAGVNSSDVEVNIKIATRAAEMAGTLTREDRNTLLSQMTPDVAQAVLHNNVRQTLCLTLAQARGIEDFGFNVDVIRLLEARGELVRSLEVLPDDTALMEREDAQIPLSRPELSVLMAHVKLALFHDLVGSSLPDNPYFEPELLGYFPKNLTEKHPKEVKGHKLRREIITTCLVNQMVNNTGPSFIHRLVGETALDLVDIVEAYALASRVYAFEALTQSLEALDDLLPHALQLEMFLEAQAVLRRTTIWFLRNRSKDESLEVLDQRYGEGLAELEMVLLDVLPPTAIQRVEERRTTLTSAGVPDETARIWSLLRYLQRGTDIIHVSADLGVCVRDVARFFFRIGSELAIDRLVAQGMQIIPNNFHERMAINRTIDGILQSHRAIVVRLLEETKDTAGVWSTEKQEMISRTRTLTDSFLASKGFGLAHLVLASRELWDLSKT